MLSPTSTVSAPPDAAFLRQLTRLIFEIGFSGPAVARRWSGFERAFCEFDPVRVAAFDARDMERLLADAAIIRNRAKLAATVENARVMVRLAATHGSFARYLEQLGDQPYEVRAGTLMEAFSHVGPRTAYAFLLEAGHADATDDPSN